MYKLFLTTAALATSMIATNTMAATETYDFDKVHTNLLMEVDHLGFTNMVLKAKDYEGTYSFDTEDFSKSKVNMVFQAAGVTGDFEPLDEHLQGPDFFNVEKFPTITYNSTSAKKTGEKTFDVQGDVTILGITKPLTLNVTFNKVGANPFSGKDESGFNATATLKRSDFGIVYALPLVGDEVKFNIFVEGVKQ